MLPTPAIQSQFLEVVTTVTQSLFSYLPVPTLVQELEAELRVNTLSCQGVQTHSLANFRYAFCNKVGLVAERSLWQMTDNSHAPHPAWPPLLSDGFYTLLHWSLYLSPVSISGF